MGSCAFHVYAPRNGIDCHSLFIAQIHLIPSKGGSELSISFWLSKKLKFKYILTWWLTVCASDSDLYATVRVFNLLVYYSNSSLCDRCPLNVSSLGAEALIVRVPFQSTSSISFFQWGPVLSHLIGQLFLSCLI